MNVSETDLPGVVLIAPTIFDDSRGIFYENWSASRYTDAGIPGAFVYYACGMVFSADEVWMEPNLEKLRLVDVASASPPRRSRAAIERM